MINCSFIGGVLVFFAMCIYAIPLIAVYVTVLSGGYLFLIGLGCGIIGTLVLVAGATCLEIAYDG